MLVVSLIVVVSTNVSSSNIVVSSSVVFVVVRNSVSSVVLSELSFDVLAGISLHEKEERVAEGDDDGRNDGVAEGSGEKSVSFDLCKDGSGLGSKSKYRRHNEREESNDSFHSV